LRVKPKVGVIKYKSIGFILVYMVSYVYILIKFNKLKNLILN